MTKQADRDALVEFWLGAAIVLVTAIMQGSVLFNNARFTLDEFGHSFLIVYATAATCYIMLPWVTPYIDGNIAIPRWILLGFCFWIGAEETFKASHAFAAPEGLTSVAELVADPEKAKIIAIWASAFIILAVLEVLWHFHGIGARMAKKNFRTVKIIYHKRRMKP